MNSTNLFTKNNRHQKENPIINQLHKTMKTQISHLRTGVKRQVKNNDVDYSFIPKSTSHVGHSGTSTHIVNSVWSKIVVENPEKMNIKINGMELTLMVNTSVSLKTTVYYATLTNDQASKFPLHLSKHGVPYILICHANDVIICNGKNDFVRICPSFIEIL